MTRYFNKITFIEVWKTPMAPFNIYEAYEELLKKGYYKDQNGYLKYLEQDHKKLMDVKMKQLPGLKEFISAIAKEHYEITKQVDSNLNYLWYMYVSAKEGEYRPFIFMAEMQLLREMGYTNEKEIENMWKMLESEDFDNFNLAFLALKNIRNLRIKEHGEYTKGSKDYEHVEKVYNTKIVSHSLFIKTGA
jgi:hypothetical protein